MCALNLSQSRVESELLLCAVLSVWGFQPPSILLKVIFCCSRVLLPPELLPLKLGEYGSGQPWIDFSPANINSDLTFLLLHTARSCCKTSPLERCSSPLLGHPSSRILHDVWHLYSLKSAMFKSLKVLFHATGRIF